MIFDYITIALIVIAFILGMAIAYNDGRIDGQREFLLVLSIKLPKVYKMLMEEISKNPNVLNRD